MQRGSLMCKIPKHLMLQLLLQARYLGLQVGQQVLNESDMSMYVRANLQAKRANLEKSYVD